MTLDTKLKAIEVNRSWSVYPGYLYGLRQPVMMGRLAVSAGADANVAALDAGIAALTEVLEYDPPAVRGTEGIAWRAAYLAIALQSYCGIPMSTGYHVASAGSAADGSANFEIALPYYELQATRLAMLWVVETFNRLLSERITPSDVRQGRKDFREFEAQLRKYALPSRNMQHFIRAAYTLDIPVNWLVANVFSFGTGCRTRLLDSTVTERTSQIGARIARNKAQTASLLRRAGLPAPLQKIVSTADEGASAAESLGFPVVVKPIDQDQGVGVLAGLRDAAAVHGAVTEASKFSGQVIVERHFAGKDFRLTVVEGTVVKVENRIAGGVIGDGRSKVAELVARKQASPRFQRILRTSGKIPLSLDAEAQSLLEELSLSGDSVPEDGRYIALRRKNNVSTGGEQVAVSVEEAHPDNIALAIRAAALLRLDIAGVDLIIGDIGRSWLDTGALICEVNAVPQVGIRTTPTVYGDILRQLVGPIARIPAHLLITADSQQPTLGELADMMAQLACNGMSLPQKVWIDGERLAARPADAFSSARILLGEQTTQGALCVVPASEIVNKGLPSDWFDSIRLQVPESQLNGRLSALSPHTASLIKMAGHA